MATNGPPPTQPAPGYRPVTGGAPRPAAAGARFDPMGAANAPPPVQPMPPIQAQIPPQTQPPQQALVQAAPPPVDAPVQNGTAPVIAPVQQQAPPPQQQPPPQVQVAPPTQVPQQPQPTQQPGVPQQVQPQLQAGQPNSAAQISQAALAALNPLMAQAQQNLLAQQLQRKINKYACWPPPEQSQQQYQLLHPLGWPVDPDYPYQLNNYLMPNPATSTAAPVAAAAMMNPAAALQAAAMMNPLMNPLVNSMGFPNFPPTAPDPSGKQYSLFVFHLPEDIDDHGLLQLFAPYGAIRSNVMRHDTGRSRGFGFVHFNSKHEAQIAIDMMNGHQIGRKRLRVSFKREETPGQANPAAAPVAGGAAAPPQQ